MKKIIFTLTLLITSLDLPLMFGLICAIPFFCVALLLVMEGVSPSCPVRSLRIRGEGNRGRLNMNLITEILE